MLKLNFFQHSISLFSISGGYFYHFSGNCLFDLLQFGDHTAGKPALFFKLGV